MLEFYGFIFVAVVGTVGHFLYEISNKNSLVGFLFAKTEAIYEHLKLGMTPMIMWMIVEKVGHINNLISIKGISFLVFQATILLIYYLTKLIIKKDIPIINISSFYIGLLFAYLTSFLLINMINLPLIIKILGIIWFIVSILSYFLVAIYKPNYCVFKDPLEKKD